MQIAGHDDLIVIICYGRYTLTTKSNSTRSTLSKVDIAKSTVSLWPSNTLAIKSKAVRHSGDKNYPLSTISTELNMFDFGDNVDRDKLATKRFQNRFRVYTPLRKIYTKNCQLAILWAVIPHL